MVSTVIEIFYYIYILVSIDFDWNGLFDRMVDAEHWGYVRIGCAIESNLKHIPALNYCVRSISFIDCVWDFVRFFRLCADSLRFRESRWNFQGFEVAPNAVGSADWCGRWVCGFPQAHQRTGGCSSGHSDSGWNLSGGRNWSGCCRLEGAGHVPRVEVQRSDLRYFWCECKIVFSCFFFVLILLDFLAFAFTSHMIFLC